MDLKFNHMVKNFTPITKGRFFNYSLIKIHAPTNDSEEEAKDQFKSNWSGHTQLAQVMSWSWRWKAWTEKLAGKPYISQQEACTAYMRVQMKMASDWSILLQAGKWRSKVRTSCTNESTSKPGTPQMDKPLTRSITVWSTEDTFLTS
jgi:hypothetical protein